MCQYNICVCRATWPAPKALIAEAYKHACTNCMDHHRRIRCLVKQALCRAMHACSMQPALAVQHVEGLLACLGLASAEILWYFLHVDEVKLAHAVAFASSC